MNGYEWDGTRWVPQASPSTPGRAQQSGPPPAAHAFVPQQAGGFTEARYGYGLTRQASDDIQFIARYMKVMIILGLVLAGLAVVLQLVTLASVLGIAAAASHR